MAYEAHECPYHNIAGWRRERLPRLPDGPIGLPPDWVLEIVSSGHEKKDILSVCRSRYCPVGIGYPMIWVIWPEDPALIAYALDGGDWRVVATLKDTDRARVPPFDALELDLGAVVGDD
ncbi:MAG: Uma2 family endonuclease [Chromatiaceae bacterium]|nr:MAG: Uma2 family endonuclease [Chromatiaceae bacterium]